MGKTTIHQIFQIVQEGEGKPHIPDSAQNSGRPHIPDSAQNRGKPHIPHSTIKVGGREASNFLQCKKKGERSFIHNSALCIAVLE